MPKLKRKTKTVFHFCSDDAALMLRAQLLSRLGYRVLYSSNGFEAIELCARERVDAVVLDFDRNQAEVHVIAREIKRCRPQLPTIVLADAVPAVDVIHELADALVSRKDNTGLVKSLQKLLSA